MIAKALIDIFASLLVIQQCVTLLTSTLKFSRLIMAKLGTAVEVRTCVRCIAFIYISTLQLFGICGVELKAWVTTAFKASNQVCASIGAPTILDKAFVNILTRCVG